jgi:hypothetical protein
MKLMAPDSLPNLIVSQVLASAANIRHISLKTRRSVNNVGVSVFGTLIQVIFRCLTTVPLEKLMVTRFLLLCCTAVTASKKECI